MLRYLIVAFIISILIYFNLKDDNFDNKEIVLGLSIPKSGIMKAWGDAVYSGAFAYFSYVNEKNLLKNKKIKLIAYDDKYEPEITSENIKKLMHGDIFAFFGFVGTPTVKNILPILQKNDIPFIAPFTGASFLRDTKEKNFINFRSSYDEEIDYIVEYLNKKKNITRFAVFYQNDDYGEEGYVSLLHSLSKRDLKLVGEGTYKRNTLSIRHAFHEIRSVQPEAVLMVGAYKANALFIKTAKKDPLFKNTYFCNISFGDANEIIKEFDSSVENLLFSEVVPSYDNDTKPLIVEYKQLMKKYFPTQELGFISLESFLAAKTVATALENIQGSITRAKFLEEIKKDLKNNQLYNKVYLFRYENSKFIEVDNEI